MTKEEMILGYREAFNNSGIHVRDNESGIDVFVKNKNGFQFITAWGSTEKKDWITDFMFFFYRVKKSPLAKEDSPIRVHSGYMEGWMRIREQVLSLVGKENVFVNGFSMGGGLSSIMAVDIQYNKNPVNLLCLDIDGPKVWNKAGMESFNRRVPNAVKITYMDDIVPKVVPWYHFGGKHVHLGDKTHWYDMSIQDHKDCVNSEMVVDLIEQYFANGGKA